MHLYPPLHVTTIISVYQSINYLYQIPRESVVNQTQSLKTKILLYRYFYDSSLATHKPMCATDFLSWLFGSGRRERQSFPKVDKIADPCSFHSWCFEIDCVSWLGGKRQGRCTWRGKTLWNVRQILITVTSRNNAPHTMKFISVCFVNLRCIKYKQIWLFITLVFHDLDACLLLNMPFNMLTWHSNQVPLKIFTRVYANTHSRF